MRVSAATLVALGALAALVAVGVTNEILPATDARTLEIRPWVAARALGITAYLLLVAQVGLGLILSHPRNLATWHLSKPLAPWHELLTVFAFAFLALHIALLAVDPYAKVGWVGALVPGFSEYRPPAIAVGTVALYALIITTVTARWTRLIPGGAWLLVHRLAALGFLGSWVHAILAGTGGATLLPLYLATGLPVLALGVHRWWARRLRPGRLEPASPEVGRPAVTEGTVSTQPGRMASGRPTTPTPAQVAVPVREDPR
jgi:DMSO/TMAO reductase YedYZ heme-binding membrane subunit